MFRNRKLKYPPHIFRKKKKIATRNNRDKCLFILFIHDKNYINLVESTRLDKIKKTFSLNLCISILRM